ncbi:MAG: hypothetical protein QUS14_01150 [Pyrinomonadaceae bacterium]|nr:hypothetical protein [Pyrinomonadaceae bacterium]
MHGKSLPEDVVVEELPDSWWYKVYAGVVLNTVIVIALLWAFSRYFSN